jgi:uncharacterized protein DUF2071
MMLQKNPVTMTGTLRRCWLFAYRTPPAQAQRFLPRPLELVTHNGYAFWNIVVCQLEHMRPQGVPPLLGVGYWHVAYRLYVRLSLPGQERIEGLYFVRSDCNSRLMTVAGNILTDFHFHTAAISTSQKGDVFEIGISSTPMPAHVCLLLNTPPQHTVDSAFATLEEAEAFLKYEPYGISVGRSNRANVVHVTRKEADWHSQARCVEQAHWAFFAAQDVALELCTEVDPIAYQWDRGRVYQLT